MDKIETKIVTLPEQDTEVISTPGMDCVICGRDPSLVRWTTASFGATESILRKPCFVHDHQLYCTLGTKARPISEPFTA